MHDIALALDIVEIRSEALDNIEGALVTTPERGIGSILLNAASSRQRRRFTIGHELLHFLNPWHRPSSAQGFWCSRADMTSSDREAVSRHRRQEAEANAFAIELLAPRARVRPFVEGEPTIAGILEMADALDISRQAAARRYVALRDERLAVLFSKEGRLTYYSEGMSGFPRLAVQRGQSLPLLSLPARDTGSTDIQEVASDDWLAGADGTVLTAETLHQVNGFAITLLHASEIVEDIEDAFDRLSRIIRD